MLRATMNAADIRTIKTNAKSSQALRRHFLSLARQVVRWSQKLSLDSVSVGVTCLDRRNGKSTVGFNLASALAKVVDHYVLFVESDFGNPYLVRKRKPGSGLSDVLKGNVETRDALTRIDQEPSLFLLGCGPAKEAESVELPLDNLKNVIVDQMSEFDYLVFDLPIADGLSACDSLATQMDGIILVVDAQDIDQKRIESFRNRMNRLGVEIIGLVINKAKA